MFIVTKLLILIILIISSIEKAYSAPCYTDNDNGCGNNDNAIIVKTKDNDNGFCTEYLNEKKQNIVHCYSSPTDVKEPTTQQNTITSKAPINVTNTTYNISNNQYQYQSQQTNEYDNDRNNQGYWNGYYQGYYNNNQYLGHGQNHRPPHHQPNPPNSVTTLPSTPFKKNNSKQSSSNHRPSPKRPPIQHKTNNYNRERTTLPSARLGK